MFTIFTMFTMFAIFTMFTMFAMFVILREFKTKIQTLRCLLKNNNLFRFCNVVVYYWINYA